MKAESFTSAELECFGECETHYSDIKDSIDIYLNRVGRRPLLSSTQEKYYARKARAGDEKAKCQLIESNLRLVVSVAKAYARSGMPLCDLIQEGNLGLIKAVNSFDPDKGFRFSTYAVGWIRQAITRAIEKNARTIRLPSYIVQAIRKLNRTGAQFVNDNGRDPTLDELAELLGLSPAKLNRIMESSETLVSLDESIDEDGNLSLFDRVNDDSASDPETCAVNEERLQLLNQLLMNLNPQEQMIIQKRFGFPDGSGETLQEIGSQLEITRERVRQVEKKAIKKLRSACSRNWLESYFMF